MKKVVILFIAFALMKSVLASSEFLCDYATDYSKKSTKISFTLPDKVAFGVLIPVEISQDSGSSAKMNTVILKDYPYMVLADVYRMDALNSKVALLKISPDRKKLQLAYIDMGEMPNSKFYQGNCQNKEE
jgi:hypothetical protein